ncbi:SHOCT domain-containing protein [Streptomyces plumbiresistens]|uniref:SHOCT domain-containing protein n=1 Tax=Streptomyces plumbiresistens TaxID=511811 RepID=A0ABP7TVX0_9ACTN
MLGRPLRRAGRPGVVGVAARTAVAAGTATAVSGRVARHQAEKAAAQQTAYQPDEPSAAQAPTPPAAPSGGLSDEALGNLERLGKLHEQGVLSDEEFAVQKDRILRG